MWLDRFVNLFQSIVVNEIVFFIARNLEEAFFKFLRLLHFNLKFCHTVDRPCLSFPSSCSSPFKYSLYNVSKDFR